jgi:hypothetical protein
MNNTNGAKAVMAALQLIAILVGIGLGLWVFGLVTG